MPIFFGWGHQTTKRIGTIFKNLCNHCHNEDYWTLDKITVWFTLFFIPVIPYSTKYFLSCPVCNYGITLDGEQLEKIKPIAEVNQLFIDGQITQEEHQLRLRQLEGSSLEDEKEVIEGDLLAIEPGTESNFCPSCGHQVIKNSKFCGKCGRKINF